MALKNITLKATKVTLVCEVPCFSSPNKGCTDFSHSKSPLPGKQFRDNPTSNPHFSLPK